MNNLEKRNLLFSLGCIPTRLYLAWLLYSNILPKELGGIVLCAIGIGFWLIYFFDLRKTGGEVFGEKIWWNTLRPFHGTMYLLAGLTYYNNTEWRKMSWKLILIDTLVGLGATVMERTSKASE